MYDFVAIDFETANNDLNSACSIGIAGVKDFEIIDERYFLIKPPTNNFDLNNIRIHGITYDDVKNSPNFSELWFTIKSYFDNAIVIAHNAHYDMSVLKNCLEYYKLETPDFTYLDSMYISDLSCSDIGRGLEARADALGVAIGNHHNALDDAITAAMIVIETIKHCNTYSFSRFCLNFLAGKSKEFKQIKAQKRLGKGFAPAYHNIKISDISAATTEFNPEHPFYNKNIVLTGELVSLERKDAIQKIVDVGGVVKSGVSKSTDYLIVGIQDTKYVGEDGRSTKEEKAYSLIDQGCSIKILSESEFINILKQYNN